MAGISPSVFAPETATSRAMIAQILYNLAEQPAVNHTANFADVAAGAWYAKAIYWANATGVATGYTNGNYGPSDVITREHLAAMLWRYAGSPASSQTLEQMAVHFAKRRTDQRLCCKCVLLGCRK